MNLLRLFEFYLFAMFFVGTVRRAGLYRSIVRLTVGLVRRYQKLFEALREEGRMLLTWSAGLPLILTLVLWGMQATLTRWIFPHAELLVRDLNGRWWFWPVLILLVVGMWIVDVYFLVCIGDIDVAKAENYFGQAESWLGTWKAKAVKIGTFGYVDPQRIVQSEIKKALTTGQQLIHTLLWWTVVQTGLRVAVGLALWIIWACGPQL
jgi:hypothetical protein